jgi:hypothetical protein
MSADHTDQDEGEMNTQTGRDVVMATGEHDGDAVAIPAELLPEEMRSDGQLRVVASVDRKGLLDAL